MSDYTPPPGYTPSDDEVKDDFLNMGVMRDEENAETLDRWYRWLAEHDRQVRVETLRSAADYVRQHSYEPAEQIPSEDGDGWMTPEQWLRDRADKIEQD